MHTRFKDFVNFHWMITPCLIQVLFWVGVATSIASGIWTIFTFGLLKGIWVIIIGPIVVRIACEAGILLFRINENLVTIKDSMIKPS